MNERWATPCRRVPLLLRSHEELDHVPEPVRGDLSAVAVCEDALWTANDGFAAVERLVSRDGSAYAEHERFHFGDVFDLPAGPHGPMDIEGLDVDGGYLWAVGSHGLVRGKALPERQDAQEAFGRLAVLEREPNRCFLGRVPMVRPATGAPFQLRTEVPAIGQVPPRRAACLEMSAETSVLERLLADDQHLAPALAWPSKENGFDIEGLAVRGERVFLGLRGPVLGRWAVILELRLGERAPAMLEPMPLASDGRLYRKYFLHLDGLGLRDLCAEGDDLLLLAGPTMDLDWPVVLYRWRGALTQDGETVTPHERLERALALPYGEVRETAEGLAVLRRDGSLCELLIVYDPPGPQRQHADGAGVDADIFILPSAR
jgi:hypothetical protein